MHMQVQQTRRDHQALHVNHLRGIGGLQPRRDFRDMTILDGDIHHRINMVLGIHDMAVSEQQIIRGSLRPRRQRQQRRACQKVFHARTAVNVAGPYSPMSTVPDIMAPAVIVPVKVQLIALPLTGIWLLI